MTAVNNAAIGECINAVSLCITLAGGICLWNGIMRVAEKSGLTKLFAKLISPVTKHIFKGVPPTSKAMQYITMNIAANMFGLGNAATPLGISAMEELYKQTASVSPGVANDNMILLVVLNTASIQLIPTTIATLRFKYGAQSPLDCYPAILLTSLFSVVFGILSAYILNRIFPIKPGKKRK